MGDEQSASKVSSGVEALIERLRQEGVDEGRQAAERIVSDAQARANWLLEQAKSEADQILSQARSEAHNLARGGREALSIAGRDAVLQLKTVLTHRFQREVKRLVGEELERSELLQKLILEVAGRAREQVAPAERVEILLPPAVQGMEALQRNPQALEKGPLSDFVRLVVGEALREGVSLVPGDEKQKGIAVRLVGEGITIDMTDSAVAELLLAHLQPRFRALLEGIVR